MEINSLYVFSYKVELGSIATYYDYSFSPRASLKFSSACTRDRSLIPSFSANTAADFDLEF